MNKVNIERLHKLYDMFADVSDEEFEEVRRKLTNNNVTSTPTTNQIQIELDMTYTKLLDLFNTTPGGELKEQIRTAIMAIRRIAFTLDKQK